VKRLGILGGMGPEAAIDLQYKVLRHTDARTDQEHLPVVVWNVPQIPERSAAIFGHGPSPLPEMQAGVAALQRLGAQCIAIACNTAHHWYAELQASVQIPVLHIADACCEMLGPGDRVGRVALLSTRGTLASGFYQQRLSAAGFDLRVPTGPQVEALARAIGCIKAGQYDQAVACINPVVEDLCGQGVQRIILACTELPLVMNRMAVREMCIDATEALAQAAVRACRPSVSRSGGERQ